MKYFKSNYSRINYPISEANNIGLRNAQLGAIHAIGAHFTLYKEEAALISMPTGSGKTLVLALAPYLLKANRVLVITSSVLVRGQIIAEFSTLQTLKGLNVFHSNLALPKVKEIKTPIKTESEWKDCLKYDVVVGIPNSINQGITIAVNPPKDLFDLILVDEAHHVPAFTWTNIITYFSLSYKIFFTATPFRRDKKEIEGRLAYNYPVTKAYEDKIFGDIGYIAVNPGNKNPDLAIALETEKVFLKDRNDGFRHYIMVRTETKDDAVILDKLYSENTKLRLKKVDSSLTYKTITKTIDALKNGELDGIICVDMLGEGFDFPNLKIAAIHSPKKSLANTLQFIGRFARTNALDIGSAKFLAIPNDIEIGKNKLYFEGAIWNDIIKDLSENKILEEDETKKTLDTFEIEKNHTTKKNLSFYNINPYHHVKIYKTDGIYLDADIQIPGHSIIFKAVSRENNSAIFISREVGKPKWLISDDIININHYLFFAYFDKECKLLFLHSSIKTIQFYDFLANEFSLNGYQRVSKYQINKVLIGISQPEFFNIGMQNKTGNNGESYRTIAGPNAENAISESYSKNYANGHIFMKGKQNETNITIGYSTGAKVWSNAYSQIPEYIKWCKSLGKKINSKKKVKTNTGFDNLPIGMVVEDFQLPAFAATWSADTFRNPPFIIIYQNEELIAKLQLLDFSIEVDKDKSNLNTIYINITNSDFNFSLSYDMHDYFQYEIEPDVYCKVEIGHEEVEFLEYLNENSLQIYLQDFATIINHEYYPPPMGKSFHFDASRITPVDWMNYNTDIKREFYKTADAKKQNENKNSIQETLEIKLRLENPHILIFDHGTGEIADFINIVADATTVKINLYHVKGTTSDDAGDRVGDLYEVCMQAVKSQAWVSNKHEFLTKVIDRAKKKPEKFLIGDLDQLMDLINENKRFEFGFCIVQPGIAIDSISTKLSYILAATDDSLINSGYQPLLILGS